MLPECLSEFDPYKALQSKWMYYIYNYVPKYAEAGFAHF